MRELEYNIGSGWVPVTLENPFDISGANETPITMRIRVIDGDFVSRQSLPATGTPTDSYNINLLSSNEGNGKCFINYEHNGSILTLQYSIANGSWTGIPRTNPAVVPYPNSASPSTVRLRISDGESTAISQSITIQSSSRENYDTFLSLNKDLQSSAGSTNLSYSIINDSTIVHEYIQTTSGWRVGVKPRTGGSWVRDHQGHIRLYYRVSLADGAGGAIGYLKSTDGGTTWTEPALNLTGNPINNAASNFCAVFDPATDTYITQVISGSTSIQPGLVSYVPGVGYLMILINHHESGSLSLALSSDGNTFTVRPGAFIRDIKSDSQFVITHDPKKSRPFMMLGRRRPGNIPRNGPPDPTEDNRSVTYSESTNWTDRPWQQTDQLDQSSAQTTGIFSPRRFGYHNVDYLQTPFLKPDLYDQGMIPYEGQYIGFFSTYRRDDQRVPTGWPDSEIGVTQVARARPDRTTGPIYPLIGWSGDGRKWTLPDLSECYLDLDTFKRVSEAPYRTSNANELPQCYTGFGMAVEGDVMYFSHQVRDDTHYNSWIGGSSRGSFDRLWRIAIHSKTKDRFFRWHPTNTAVESIFRSSIVRIQDDATMFKINCDITGSIKVELLNAITGDPITGYAKADCDAVSDASLYNNVTWGGKTVAPLSGQNVRVKIYMTNAEFYAWKF